MRDHRPENPRLKRWRCIPTSPARYVVDDACVAHRADRDDVHLRKLQKKVAGSPREVIWQDTHSIVFRRSAWVIAGQLLSTHSATFARRDASSKTSPR